MVDLALQGREYSYRGVMYMLNKKELVKHIIVIVLGLVLWYLTGVLYLKIQVAAKDIIFPQYNIYRALMGLILTLFGILIEWKTLLKIWKQGKTIRIGLLILAVIIIIFPMIPFEASIKFFGISSLHSFKGIISLLYESSYSRSVASILGGILLVKSFKKGSCFV